MKKYILTVTLNPAIDKVICAVDRVEAKEYIKGKEEVSPGGKGINVSRALRALNQETLALGLCAGRNGEWLKKLLRKEKIPTALIKMQGETRVNLTFVDTTSKKILRVLEVGPKMNTHEQQRVISHYKQLLAKSQCVVLSGRNIRGASRGLYAKLIRMAHSNNVFTVLDTSGESLRQALKAKPSIIKPNLHEAEELFQRKLNTVKKRLQAIEQLHAMGISIVLLSLGKNGIMASNKECLYQVKPPRAKVSFDVGCGDAVIAGFLSFYLNKESFLKSVQWAVSCGTANLQNRQPGLIRKSFVKTIMKKVEVRNIKNSFKYRKMNNEEIKCNMLHCI